MRAMREGMDSAIEQLMTCRPDHLIFGVAIEAFSGGVKGAEQFQQMLAEKAGVGATIGFDRIRRRPQGVWGKAHRRSDPSPTVRRRNSPELPARGWL